MTDERPGARRSKLIAAAVLGATLVAGTLAGAAADRVLGGRGTPAEHPDREPCAGAPGGVTVFDALDLSAEQRGRVDAILERRRGEMDVLWQEARPRMRALVDSTEAEIKRVLSPEQRLEFDRMREEGRKLGLKRQRDWKPDSAGTPASPGAQSDQVPPR
jgi:Spy/CpxP family protein refolding chaperone